MFFFMNSETKPLETWQVLMVHYMENICIYGLPVIPGIMYMAVQILDI